MDKVRKQTTKGLKPKDRKLATKSSGKLTANQWQNTPQQHVFMENWFSPTSPSFGNAYKSALAAGYSDKYAAQISSPAVSNNWIQEYTRRLVLTEDHIIAALSDIATGKQINSKSPADTQVKALEILGKIRGMIDNKGNTTNVIVTPILNGESVRAKAEIIE